MKIIHDNAVRNDQIICDVKACVASGRTPVVLTRYTEHAQKLYERLRSYAD